MTGDYFNRRARLGIFPQQRLVPLLPVEEPEHYKCHQEKGGEKTAHAAHVLSILHVFPLGTQRIASTLQTRAARLAHWSGGLGMAATFKPPSHGCPSPNTQPRHASSLEGRHAPEKARALRDSGCSSGTEGLSNMHKTLGSTIPSPGRGGGGIPRICM